MAASPVLSSLNRLAANSQTPELSRERNSPVKVDGAHSVPPNPNRWSIRCTRSTLRLPRYRDGNGIRKEGRQLEYHYHGPCLSRNGALQPKVWRPAVATGLSATIKSTPYMLAHAPFRAQPGLVEFVMFSYSPSADPSRRAQGGM